MLRELMIQSFINPGSSDTCNAFGYFCLIHTAIIFREIMWPDTGICSIYLIIQVLK
jgi:hypothetical protein